MKPNKADRRCTSRNPVTEALLAALVWLVPVGAQAQAIEAWARLSSPSYTSSGLWSPYSFSTVDSSGNVVVTCQYQDGANNPTALLTMKYSSAGVPLWTNRYGGPGNGGIPQAIAADTSGNVIVAGGSQSASSVWDFAAIKYSSTGEPLWTNLYQGPVAGGHHAWAIAVDASGNVYVTGEEWVNSSDCDILTIKYSSAGVPLRTNRCNWPGGLGTYAWVAGEASGSAVVTGQAYADYLTIKYSSAGVPLWTNWYNGAGGDAVAVDASGNVCVAAETFSNTSQYDYLTFKYSSDGAVLWTNPYVGPGNGYDIPMAIAVDARGNVFVTGYTDDPYPKRSICTVGYSSAGMPLFTNLYIGPGNKFAYARNLAVDASGNVYVTGISETSDSTVDTPEFVYATVKYIIPPIITRQPPSCSNVGGSTASFTVEVAGSLPLSYQWRRQGTNLLDGGNISGVTTTNLRIANVQLADAAGYSVVVTNAYGSATSIVAQLTATIPPSPGRFTSFSYSPTMGFSFIFRDGTVGQHYRIQTSSSLAAGSWVDWQPFTYSGPVGFMDVGATGAERRFYRAVSP